MAWSGDRGAFALLFDDSFYYLAIARNVAEGYGSTFDRLTPTNGYHPLWLGLCVPLFLAGLDDMGAVRVALTASIGMYAAALAGVAAIAVRNLDGAPWPRDPAATRAAAAATIVAATAAVGLNPFVARTFANAMETAPYALACVGLLAVADRAGDALIRPEGRAYRVAGAALLSLAFLARTDAGLLLPCVALWALPELRRAPVPTARALVELLLPPSLVILGFLAFNQLAYGHPMQVSGELKRVAPTALRLVWIAVCLALPFVVVSVGGASAAFPRMAGAIRRTAWFAGFVAVLVAYYTGVQTFARLWYFGPPVLWGLVVALNAAADLVARAVAEDPAKPPARAALPLQALLLAPLFGGAAYTATMAFDPATQAPMLAARDAGRWMAENLPEDTIASSWDAGAIGYFAPQRVVNLDGVVASHAYLRALREGTTADYLAPLGIDFVVNHGLGDDPVEGLREDGAALFGQEAAGRWTVEQRWDFAFTGSSNDVGQGTHEMAMILFRTHQGAVSDGQR